MASFSLNNPARSWYSGGIVDRSVSDQLLVAVPESEEVGTAPELLSSVGGTRSENDMVKSSTPGWFTRCAKAFGPTIDMCGAFRPPFAEVEDGLFEPVGTVIGRGVVGSSLLIEFFGNRGFLCTGLRETSLRLLGGKAVVDSSLLSLKSSPRF